MSEVEIRISGGKVFVPDDKNTKFRAVIVQFQEEISVRKFLQALESQELLQESMAFYYTDPVWNSDGSLIEGKK